jgi:hypothetical protein
LAAEFDATFLPVRIIGRRWEHFAERLHEDVDVEHAERIDLGCGYGVVVYGWDGLSTGDRLSVGKVLADGPWFPGEGKQ